MTVLLIEELMFGSDSSAAVVELLGLSLHNSGIEFKRAIQKCFRHIQTHLWAKTLKTWIYSYTDIQIYSAISGYTVTVCTDYLYCWHCYVRLVGLRMDGMPVLMPALGCREALGRNDRPFAASDHKPSISRETVIPCLNRVNRIQYIRV